MATTIEITLGARGSYLVKTPYRPAFGQALRRHGAGALWCPEARQWVVPAGCRAELWRALIDAFAGHPLHTPTGWAEIPRPGRPAPAPAPAPASSRAQAPAAASAPPSDARAAAAWSDAELARAYDEIARWAGNGPEVAGYAEAAE